MRLNGKVGSLFKYQLNEWELAGRNYAGLKHIQTRRVVFDDIEILLQYNPMRILSSAAKVDPQSISDRPCFLCEKNRPAEQQGIRYKKEYILLVNPYPVFTRHLTIPSLLHRPQLILPDFFTMLELARDLQDYVVIYNGPQCGASAPDHFHFQAVCKGTMPIESDFSGIGRCLYKGEIHGAKLYTWNNYLRQIITFTGHDVVTMATVFRAVYEILTGMLPSTQEPMLNILAWHEKDGYIVHVIPRKLHRPDRFFARDDSRLLISPASIDLGGVLIMPREEDFLKITNADIGDVFRQVCVDDEFITYLVRQLIHHP